jgi:hypothetical protein
MRGPLADDASVSGAGGGPGGGAGGGAGGAHGGAGGAAASGGASGAGGTAPVVPSDASVPGNPAGIVLLPTTAGFVVGNAAGVVGSWYAFADGYGALASTPGGGRCQLAGHSDCSVFVTPTPNMPFAPSPSGQMCTAGHAAQVPPAGATFDYANVYGATIALNFDQPTAGAAPIPYDALDRTPPIRGISFETPHGGGAGRHRRRRGLLGRRVDERLAGPRRPQHVYLD